MGIAWSTELMNFVFIFCSIITSKKHFLHAETVSTRCHLSPHLMTNACQSHSGLVQRGCQHLNHQWKFLIQRNGWIRVHCVSEAANLRLQRVRKRR